MKRSKSLLLALPLILALPTLGWSKIDLVTLPNRDKTDLTIYNEIDLTLVRETRFLSFRKGENEIQFSWSGVMVDPTSLELDLGIRPGIEVLDAVYPAGSENTIVWTVVSEEPGMVPVEIRYFVSGLTWSAENTIVSDEAAGTFTLKPEIRISNESGEDFNGAHIRVIVGAPNLIVRIMDLVAQWGMGNKKDTVSYLNFDLDGDFEINAELEQISPFASPGMGMSSPFGGAPDAIDKSSFGGFGTDRKEVFKKAVSEYQLYSVEGEIDLQSGWSYQIPNPETTDIPFELNDEVDNRSGNPIIRYKTINDEDHELGKVSLPNGQYFVYKESGEQGISYVGKNTHDYIPIGGEMELELGFDSYLGYEHKLLSFKRSDFHFDKEGDLSGWNDTRRISIELKNGRSQPVSVKLTEFMDYRDWEIAKTTHPDYKKLTDMSLRWELNLDPNSTTTIEFDVRYKMGLNAVPPPPVVPVPRRSRR
jgi:hypothetical protein